ncbi:MAG: RluA family pseudouridine synthase [Gammaproteobacteria bacterium]|nr:RluA family pseudouridine synthase [Gammaproteobacteria bacterium]
MQNSEQANRRALTVEVTDAEAGQRLDNFLLARCSGVPKSHIYRIIRSGEVRVNSGRVKPKVRVQSGDKVRIPPIRLKPQGPVTVPQALADALANSVIYEHRDFLVVNKPAGLAVHKGSGLVFGAIDGLRQGLAQPQLELVHRIDRGTSGALVVARDRGICRSMQALFRDHEVKKDYLALVAGRWAENSQTINLALLKNVETAGERRVVVDPKGKPAVSHFLVKQRFDLATLMAVSIETGRTHQIRVHAASAGHPVVGDTRYGQNATNTAFRQTGLERLYLHASELSFQWSGETHSIQAPVDSGWTSALASLA